MFDLKRKLLVLVFAVACSLPMGVYGQRQGDKRPPKDGPRVVVEPKGQRPPPSNNNQGDKKQGGDKKPKN